MAKRAKRKAATVETPHVGGYCATCAWWDRRRETLTYEVKDEGAGVCRVGTPSPGLDVPWPFTAADDWCPEYERETVWDEDRRGDHVV